MDPHRPYHLLGIPGDDPRFKPGKNKDESQYVFARLPAATIRSS